MNLIEPEDLDIQHLNLFHHIHILLQFQKHLLIFMVHNLPIVKLLDVQKDEKVTKHDGY
jgi:hypothetical protein